MESPFTQRLAKKLGRENTMNILENSILQRKYEMLCEELKQIEKENAESIELASPK